MYNQKYLDNEIPLKKETLEIPEEILNIPPSRKVATGYKELDRLLIGGIPETYPVILTSPFCDERDRLIKRFLEKGLEEEEITFFVNTDISEMKNLAKEFQSNFFIFICNPRADIIFNDFPNMIKLDRGVTNLTDINLSLATAFRRLDDLHNNSRRICITIISDVLLQHKAATTKKWLTDLVTELRSNGFTTLAVMNPLMHPPQDVQAILGLFEGEITIKEQETEKGSKKFLRIKRMYNQKYLDNEIPLKKEN
jgi:KaiC/GvpD/RAD55 family RecA-like ATPase